MTSADARLSACLSFDFDAQSVWIGSMQSNNPAQISRGEFGAYVIPRILRLLEKHEIGATFFVPGHTAVSYPELIKRIVDAGHEIGHHGWVHENPANFDLAGEKEIFEKGLEALDRAAGVRPTGYRSPAADFSVNTIDVLLEYGIEYDSSCAGSDFVPYYLRSGDAWTTDGPFVFGRTVDLLELPFSWGLDDFPHVEFAPGFSTNLRPASAVREVWQAEFDYAYAETPGGVYGLCMHPQATGRGRNMMLLEGLIGYIKDKGDVRFEPLGAYASRWREANPVEEWKTKGSIHVRENVTV